MEHQLEAAVAADVQAFRADGYVKLPSDLLAPEDLAELRRVFKREQAIWRSVREEERQKSLLAGPEQRWRSPGYFDFPWTAATDDAFLKLVCNPRLVKIVERVVGDDVCLQDLRSRTVLGLAGLREGVCVRACACARVCVRACRTSPSLTSSYQTEKSAWCTGDGTFQGEGSARAYTGGFHHDGGQIGFADHETLSQSVKLFFAISDQDIETGCTSVIPGVSGTRAFLRASSASLIRSRPRRHAPDRRGPLG